MVTYKNVSYKDILTDFTYTFKEKEITTILGSPSQDKTVIFDLLEGLILPTSGTIKINNIKELKKYRSKIGYLFKNPQDQLFQTTVYKEISFGLKNFHYKENKIDKIVKDSLKIVGLDDTYLDKCPFNLSYGEKVKLSLASILVLNPKILLLDNPTNGLDNKSITSLINLLKKLKNTYNKTIIIISNNINFITKVTDNIIILNKGTLITSSKKENILKDIDLLKENNIEIPPIIEFIHYANKHKNINLAYTLDINELIKDVYRNV